MNRTMGMNKLLRLPNDIITNPVSSVTANPFKKLEKLRAVTIETEYQQHLQGNNAPLEEQQRIAKLMLAVQDTKIGRTGPLKKLKGIK